MSLMKKKSVYIAAAIVVVTAAAIAVLVFMRNKQADRSFAIDTISDVSTEAGDSPTGPVDASQQAIDAITKSPDAAAKKPQGSGSQTPPTPTVTYSVTTAGTISASVSEFASQAQETLSDNRGWPQLGIRFRQVQSGGDFTLILANANQMEGFSSGCSAEWSCRVGQNVIINQDRWTSSTSSWSGGGGSLRDYRNMVINHEVGHWLGLDHQSCPAAGSPAPIMQQQSISLQSCAPNPWPLQSDLFAPRFSIDKR